MVPSWHVLSQAYQEIALRLADFILDQFENILKEWDHFARTVEPAASSMTEKELRNHAAEMLKCVANDLRTTQSRQEAIEKSYGNGPATVQTEAGEQHGLARLDSHFTIEQLASEYRALRSSVLRLWSEANTTPSATDIGDLIRFNEAIDQLLAASILSFARVTREALEAEKKRKDQFLAMLAHELRNPLSPISAAATLLKMAKSNDTVVINASNIIARQVAHMATLVEDLLDVSRVKRGAIDLKLEPLDLRQVILDAVEQVTPLMESRQHALIIPELPQPVPTLGDRKRLVQVITNLLTNAAKYTPERGHIELKLDLYEGQVAITIEDNGVGMAPDFVPHVFDIFAQAERTSDRTTGGPGLGLALVKCLTELHGGKATCSSAGQGRGSKFTVWLPKKVVDESRIERRRSVRVDVSSAEKLKIMVVDDNVDAAFMLATLLEAAGHDVIVANGGQEAFDRSKAAAPDVFVLDIGLPDIDGNELARTLRAQPETSHAMLIALTGYGQAQDLEQTRAAGFDYHLVKPVDSERLSRLLRGVARSKP
jgi:signal transduction histidine kinase/ActR/RegA family two-component response regulator